MVLSYNLTLAEVLKRASVFLQEHGINDAPVKDYWQRVFEINFTQLILAMNNPVSHQQVDRFNEVLQRLAKHEPIQYIVGKTDFMDETFIVSPAVLIPREDTYGLVAMGSEYLQKYPTAKVLDIGTGSGIIAIQLAKQASQAQVTAVDISPAALTIAQKNAQHHQVVIRFLESDLVSAVADEKFDLIVSNPPYIATDELLEMDESVKRYEPKIALFAENHGLAIYDRLAKVAPKMLSEKGQIIVEIGYRQAPAVRALFKTQLPQAMITVHQDLNGLDRYVKISL